MQKVLLAAVLVFGLAGCGSNDVVQAPLKVSVGQQLIDLKHAYDTGAMTEREYDNQRKQLIKTVR